MYNIRKMEKMKRSNKAVSEVVGTLLLLGMSISFFTVIYISVLTLYPTASSPSVNFICSIEDENVTLEHRGGKSLDLDTKLILNIGGVNYDSTVGKNLTNEAKVNGLWDIGERIVYYVGDITNKNVSVSVVDVKSNSVIMLVVFQG
jgi:FlaG/FlaF family flagellin (archaellin)